jgi:hypothetical protein
MDLAVMLKYYVVWITESNIANFNETNLSSLKDPFLLWNNKGYLLNNKSTPALYILWHIQNWSGTLTELPWVKNWYINPINIDQYTTSKQGTWFDAIEYNNKISWKSDIFYEQFVLPSFKKLFITDRLIPEQSKLNWQGSSVFTKQNNTFGFDATNSYLASKFKFWTSEQPGVYDIKENKFVLDLLSWNNKKFFPIIGANLIVSKQWVGWVNYCGGWTNYYLDWLCYDATTGNSRL